MKLSFMNTRSKQNFPLEMSYLKGKKQSTQKCENWRLQKSQKTEKNIQNLAAEISSLQNAVNLYLFFPLENL